MVQGGAGLPPIGDQRANQQYDDEVPPRMFQHHRVQNQPEDLQRGAHRQVNPPRLFNDSSSDEELERISDGYIQEDIPRYQPRNQQNTQNLNPPRYQRYHNDFQYYQIKIDLASFDGHLHLEDFLDWLHNVENFFECMNINS